MLRPEHKRPLITYWAIVRKNKCHQMIQLNRIVSAMSKTSLERFRSIMFNLSYPRSMSKKKDELEANAADTPQPTNAEPTTPNDPIRVDDKTAESPAQEPPNPDPLNNWLQEEQYFHYDFDGDMHIGREVFGKIPIEDVANIIKAVFAKVKSEGGLKTDTLYFKNGRLRVVVKDSNSREEINGSDLSRSGQWHRNNKHHTVITVEELS